MSISKHTGNEVSIVEREKNEEISAVIQNDKNALTTVYQNRIDRIMKGKDVENDVYVEVEEKHTLVEGKMIRDKVAFNCNNDNDPEGCIIISEDIRQTYDCVEGASSNLHEENLNQVKDNDIMVQDVNSSNEMKNDRSEIRVQKITNTAGISNDKCEQKDYNINENKEDKSNGNMDAMQNSVIIPNVEVTENGEPRENGDDSPLDEGSISMDERADENAESAGSFVLEEDLNLSRRVFRNFYICSIFIHGTLLLMVLLLMGILCYDFIKVPSVSNKEKIMIYFCGLLLTLLGLHIFLNLYMSIRLLRQAEISKFLKSVESKMHVIILVYFFICAYTYFFEWKNYPINSTFYFSLILVIIYYFMPIFLYIVLRILFVIVIFILLFVKRKSPTPKKILKKLKIMKYAEYRKYCEDEDCMHSDYFKNWRELNGEKDPLNEIPAAEVSEIMNTMPVEVAATTRQDTTTTTMTTHLDIPMSTSIPIGDNKGSDRISIEITAPNYNVDGNTISTVASCVQHGNSNIDEKREGHDEYRTKTNVTLSLNGNNKTRNNIERHSFYRNAIGVNGGRETTNNPGTQANDRKNDDRTSRSSNVREINNVHSCENDKAVSNIRECTNELNKDGKESGLFEYFQKVLKKKKGSLENDKIEVPENKIEENSFHINIESSDYACSICCTEYLEDDDICILPCNYLHYFHKECIFTWLKRNNDCPLCRKCIGKM
ncbi:circumsporozoite protein [Plasmodium gonderi]|uniref:Circumsporozoite protein n=1 Tax=Plasmodium gonderi TaxID=77519 RepID=A0A1Y1JPK7_PLAGO|nr:circumsporozoite protein [Plasmodium gonderi]GAW83157.1 circumsporozoite protein [Plasmodium gonderi]